MKESNVALKKETESLKNNENINKNKVYNILTDISKKIKTETKVNVVRTIINFIFSIFVLGLIYFVINNYEKKWEMTYYLTIWTFFLNGFYMVSVTAIDLTRIIKNMDYCIKYNNFIRKHYIRICFPFSISIVFLFWMLILLGDEFQYNSRSLWDILVNICFHGLQFVFLLYDTLSYPHQVEINKIRDIIIITIMTAVYFIILGFAKYMLDYNPYDFMIMSNVRQIIGAAILIYIAILDGYVVFVLIAGKCFVDKNINLDNVKTEIKKQLDNMEKNNKENKEVKINNDKKENGEVNSDIKGKNNNNDINNNNNVFNNELNNKNKINDWNHIIIPKNKKKKLKPIQFKNNINKGELDEKRNQ